MARDKLQGVCECGRWTHHTTRDGFNFWGDARGQVPEGNFCAACGTRLNADGSADPGSVAWAKYDEEQDYAVTRVDRMRAALAEGGVALQVLPDAILAAKAVLEEEP